MYPLLLVRYGEISLKGRNRRMFEDILIQNIKSVLNNTDHGQITKTFGRIYIETKGNWEEIADLVSQVFGIVSLSPVLRCELDFDAIKTASETIMNSLMGTAPPATFKVETRRSNKRFPMPSMEVSRELGAYILQTFPDISVDVHQPDAILHVEIRQEGVYIYSEMIPALGGLPAGSSGKGLLLLSGGIDSPVAGFLSMKRGVAIEGLHFHSYPFTTERSKEKVIELGRLLSRYNHQGNFKLWVSYFTEIQKALQANPYPSLKITIMRRLMLRIASELAKEKRAYALITGDSLGQVASQTMESIYTINAVTNMPIYRPLIGMDKQEIIEISRQIGTYETSILPYEDCCTVFVPKNPATRPTIEQALEAEAHLDVEGLIQEAVEKTSLVETNPY